MLRIIILATIFVNLLLYYNAAVAQTNPPETTLVNSELQSSSGELYVNEEVGFEIKGPLGWLKQLGTNGDPLVATFYKTKDNGRFQYPVLGVTVESRPASDNIKTALDFANLVFPEYKAASEQMQVDFRVVEAPHEIEINGMKAARFIIEIGGGSKKAMKTIDYKFLKGNMIISIQGADTPESFTSNLSYFEGVANTFKFKSTTR